MGYSLTCLPCLNRASINFFFFKRCCLGNLCDRSLTWTDMMNAGYWREYTLVYCLWRRSSETDNFFFPRDLLRVITALPLADAILALKPCLFLLFLFDGWKVLFIAISTGYLLSITYILKTGCKDNTDLYGLQELAFYFKMMNIIRLWKHSGFFISANLESWVFKCI